MKGTIQYIQGRKGRMAKGWKLALSLGGILLLGGSAAWAQQAAGPTSVSIGEDFIRELRIMLIMLGIIIFLVVNILILMSVKDAKYLSLKYIIGGFTGRNAEDPVMDHDYDGIRELDNPVPAWLRLIMYGGVAFAFVYIIHFHVLGTGPSQLEEYQLEMAEAELKYKSVELPDDMIRLVTEPGRLERARTIFVENCATCHKENLGGDSGPNLTDEYWLHGGTVKEIYATITNGVEGKAMISWKSRISSNERLELASYILAMQGTNPPDPRDPEGTKMGEGTDSPAPDSTNTDAPAADSLPAGEPQ